MAYFKILVMSIGSSFLLSACDNQIQEAEPVSSVTGLKDIYADYFPIGASLSPANLSGKDSSLIVTEFNSVTAENVMKPSPIQPEQNQFNWGPADAMVNFVEENGLKMRGHTLCWHNQVGDWMFENEEGGEVDKQTLLRRLKEHIQAVVGRYQDHIYAWDVVNEVIADEGEAWYRDSRWYQITGEEFIAKAFEYAHEADSNATLFYNDYNATNPDKMEKIVKMLTQLKEEGVPIHGMGLQGHWSIYYPSEAQLRTALETYKELGLEIQITELDISVYPGESGGRREKSADELDTFTEEMEQQQIAQYKMIFKVLRDYRDVITGVTFWNVSDAHSWLDNFPVKGRKNYPLLFDQNRERKKAYEAVIDF